MVRLDCWRKFIYKNRIGKKPSIISMKIYHYRALENLNRYIIGWR